MKKISAVLNLFCFTLLFSCTPNPVKTVEFIPIDYKIVAEGDYAESKQKLLLVTYNKHFNQNSFSEKFIEQNHLDTIDYKRNMLVEIFLGEMPKTGYEIKIDKIEENKDLIKVHYSVTPPKESENNEPSSPYLIAQIHKSRKKVEFYENGEQVKMEPKNLYIQN